MKRIHKLIQIANIQYVRHLVVLCSIILPLSISQLLVTQATGSVLQMTLDEELSKIRSALIFMALLTLIKITMNVLYSFFSKTIQGEIEYSLRTNFVSKIFRMKFSELQQRKVADLLSIYTNDLGQAVELLTADAFSLLLDLFTIIVYGAFMFRLQLVNTFIFFLLFPPLILIQIKISKPIEKRMKILSSKRGEYSGIILDSLKSLPVIKSYRLEETMEARFTRSYTSYFQEIVHYIHAFSNLVTIGLSLSSIPMIFAFVTSGIGTINGTLSVGNFVVYTTLAMAVNDWLLMLAQRFGRLRTKIAQADRVVLAVDVNMDQIGNADAFLNLNSTFALSFFNVSAAYTPGTSILNNISFQVRKGESVAIVGKSGCGKTTVCRLLMSFLDPERGKIQVFDQDIAQMMPQKQRGYFAYVPQKQSIMMKSIAENVSFSNERAISKDKLEEACRMADIDTYIDTLPQGYQTQVTEFASNMSGGQSQRIALARAFYKNAPILLLDESTASLDVETEKQILQTILNVKGQKTILFITHRVTVLKNFDRILVMDNGKICGDGSFDMLLSENKVFQSLYAQQGEKKYEW